MEDTSFNKYQFSVFTKDQGQFVVRSNDFEEFTEQLKQILAIKKASDAIHEPVTPENDVQAHYNAPSADLGVCPDCGAPNIVYKKSGKVGCSAYCWNKNSQQKR